MVAKKDLLTFCFLLVRAQIPERRQQKYTLAKTLLWLAIKVPLGWEHEKYPFFCS